MRADACHGDLVPAETGRRSWRRSQRTSWICNTLRTHAEIGPAQARRRDFSRQRLMRCGLVAISLLRMFRGGRHERLVMEAMEITLAPVEVAVRAGLDSPWGRTGPGVEPAAPTCRRWSEA